MRSVLISILNFNGKKETLECLKSLEKIVINEIKVKILVVDNNSIVPFEESDIVDYKYDFEIIKNNKNLGFSGGHNVSFNYAIDHNYDFILILNNDTTVDKYFLQNLYKKMKFREDLGAVGPKIYFRKGSEFHKNRYSQSELGKVIWFAGGKIDWKNMIASHIGVDEVDHGQFDKKLTSDFISGCCMLIPVAVLKEIGNFDDRYFLYLEDLDLNMRIIKAGYSVELVPDSIIWHTNASSSGGSGSPLQDYYISRNRMLFGFKYTGIRTKIALVKESIRILINGRPNQKLGVRDFYLRNFGKGSYGKK